MEAIKSLIGDLFGCDTCRLNKLRLDVIRASCNDATYLLINSFYDYLSELHLFMILLSIVTLNEYLFVSLITLFSRLHLLTLIIY
jgi:hypothetical protein